MVKVLFIYYEPFQSGQTTHVLSLVKNIDRKHFQPYVVLPECLGQVARVFSEAGAEVYPLRFGKIFWSWQSTRSLVTLVRKENIGIVHVHSQEAGLVARPLTWLAGVQHRIYTPQTIDIRQKSFSFLYRFLESVLSRITDTIISVNELDRGRMLRWGIPAKKLRTIPNGIDLQAFLPEVDICAAKQRVNMDPGRPLVVQVGRLSEQKDPFGFVDGAEQVLKKHPQVQFVLVGDGPQRGFLDDYIVKKGLDHAIHRVGWQKNVSDWLQAADVVTLTSAWEGSPYSILEAMACSAPVVVYAVNGCGEIVQNQETGFVVPPGSVDAWAERVSQLVEQKELALRMGKSGRQKVEECFSLPAIIRQIESLYLAFEDKELR